MATRRIVPRGDGEGGLGTALKRWGPIHTTEIHADNISTTIPDASESEKGLVQLASAAEVNAGTDAEKAVVPATLHQRQSTEAIRGLIELATSAEVIAGTDTQRAVTPAGLQAARAFASTVQAEEGTLDNVVMSPAATLASISANAPDTPFASEAEVLAGEVPDKAVAPDTAKLSRPDISAKSTDFTAAAGNLYLCTPASSTTLVATLPTTNRGKIGFRLEDASGDRVLAIDPTTDAIEDEDIGDVMTISVQNQIIYLDWDGIVWRRVV